MIFRVCFDNHYSYSNDIIDAKIQLNRLGSLISRAKKIGVNSIKSQTRSLRDLVEKSEVPYLLRESIPIILEVGLILIIIHILRVYVDLSIYKKGSLSLYI